ncbi:hypothetical protein [Cellulomonas soli]
MLCAAALVPDTALLVPGAGGLADDLVAGLRAAALEAVAAVLAVPTARVVVVAPGREERTFAGPVRASLAAAGIPDTLLRWPVPGPAGAPVPGVAAGVALHLIHHVRGADHLDVAEVVEVVEVAGSTPAERLRARGAALVAGAPTALVVVGSSSGRHGPDAPLADDPRALAVDAALLADLADPSPAARARLAGFDPQEALALAVTGWAPWQVLVGAAHEQCDLEGRLLAAGEPAGAAHAVATWLPAGAGVVR